jgi:hypothetical protein
MEEAFAFGSREYALAFGALIFARGMDFLSTWIATPTLLLEANPLARKLRWKWGMVVNIMLCVGFAFLPLAAIIIATTSVLVAARNFQLAWLMRSHGEENYRDWFVERMDETPPTLFMFCLLAQTSLTALVGVVLAYTSGWQKLVPLGIGLGIVGYAAAVTIYTVMAIYRRRRATRYR